MLVLYVVSNNMPNYRGIAHVIHITQIFIFTHDVALATCTYNVVNTCITREFTPWYNSTKYKDCEILYSFLLM